MTTIHIELNDVVGQHFWSTIRVSIRSCLIIPIFSMALLTSSLLLLSPCRRSVRYKHRYSSMLPESDETFMSSQVPQGQDNFRPPGCISQPETADPDVELQEKEFAGE